MGSRVLIDTSIVIDLLRNVPYAVPEIRKHTDRAIGIVTWMEVMVGLKPSDQHVVDLFEQTSQSFSSHPMSQRKPCAFGSSCVSNCRMR